MRAPRNRWRGGARPSTLRDVTNAASLVEEETQPPPPPPVAAVERARRETAGRAHEPLPSASPDCGPELDRRCDELRGRLEEAAAPLPEALFRAIDVGEIDMLTEEVLALGNGLGHTMATYAALLLEYHAAEDAAVAESTPIPAQDPLLST